MLRQQTENRMSVFSSLKIHYVTDFIFLRNIPLSSRIIDQRKGPINRNAATRSLPKINKQ